MSGSTGKLARAIEVQLVVVLAQLHPGRGRAVPLRTMSSRPGAGRSPPRGTTKSSSIRAISQCTADWLKIESGGRRRSPSETARSPAAGRPTSPAAVIDAAASIATSAVQDRAAAQEVVVVAAQLGCAGQDGDLPELRVELVTGLDLR